MESAPADVLSGRMLDRRYHVRSRIAHGGMATVYLATDTRLDREVALKVMHADLARDGDFVGRFIGEAKSVAKLSHPNIVGVFDQGADGDVLYLVMEYVPGRTLRALMQERGWLPWQEALAIMDPVLAGLAAAHQAGIVHRDIKPENVLITADGRVKVVDFGLARTSAAVGNTKAGMIIGSVAYIAPEQVTGAPTDPRTDVYAAGIVLFEMLTGRQPFSGATPLETAHAHVKSDVPAVSSLAGGIPPSVDQLIQAATSRDPQRRPTNAGVFLRVTRALRGLREPGEAVTGAWGAVPGQAPGRTIPYNGPNGAGGQNGPSGPTGTGRMPVGGPGGGAPGSRTMVVGAGFPGYDDAVGRDAGPGGRGGAGGRRDGDREPFLQRWLFSRRLVYVLVALALLLGAGGGAWWLNSGRYTNVPVVAKLSAAQAAKALRQAGFKAVTGPSVINDDVPKGEVISTSPSGRAAPGATITMTVSQGPKMISVPSIPATDTVAQAQAALRAAGLTVAAETKKVGVPANPVVGTVAGTDPPAGTSWPENKAVTIEEVAGLALPNLVGQAVAPIQAWAAQNQIQLQVTQVQSSQAQGTILSQSPAAGQPVAPGGTVTVQVSNGPPTVAVPDVSGQDCQTAYNTLAQAGFQVSVQQQGFHKDQASGTDPAAGQQVPQGSAVHLACGSWNPF
jgi:serine/threonine-protein kinase